MFNVTIEQRALMKALEYLEPTVGKNSTNLGDNCLSMESTSSGSISMYTTNTIEFTKVEVLATSQNNDIAPYVDFKRFKGIISTIPESEFITLEQNVNDLLISFSLRTKPITLIGCNNGMLPFPTVHGNLINLPKLFVKNAVDKASSIIIDSDSAPLYNCIRFITDNQVVTVEAIDVTYKRSYTIVSTANFNNPKQDILVEASKLKKSLKIFEDYNEIEMVMDATVVSMRGEDMIQVGQKTGGNIRDVVYCARRLSGAFPSLANYIQNQPTEYIMVSREELMNSLTRVKALGDDSSFKNGIKIEVNNGAFVLNFSSSYGDLTDPVDVNNNGYKGSFVAHLRHNSLEEIVKTMTDSVYVNVGIMNGSNGNYVVKGNSTTGSMYNNEIFTLLGMSPAGPATP